MSAPTPDLAELNRWMAERYLHGYWTQEGGGPGAQRRPRLWRWADVSAGLLKAAALLPADPSGLTTARAIALRDREARGIPRTVEFSARILMPGERTQPRRDSSNAAALVIQAGPGARFLVEGESIPVASGDLIVAPAGSTRSEENPADEPLLWIDSRDAGLSALMGVTQRPLAPDEGEGPKATPSPPSGERVGPFDRLRVSGAPTTRAASNVEAGDNPAPSPQPSPPMGARGLERPSVAYPWAESLATLAMLQERCEGWDPCDGFMLRFASPADGGPTFPTFSCEAALIPAGARTRAHRHNSAAVCCALRGTGCTEVAGERLKWAQGDVFCIPPWTWHHHESLSDTDAILFFIDDWPAMVRMGFYRVETSG